MIKKGIYIDVNKSPITPKIGFVEVIGETEYSCISDDPKSEHIGVTNLDTWDVNVVFIMDGKMITNNSLGILVIFKQGHKFFYLSKDKFINRFKIAKRIKKSSKFPTAFIIPDKDKGHYFLNEPNLTDRVGMVIIKRLSYISKHWHEEMIYFDLNQYNILMTELKQSIKM
jgi:hypothetical protein